MNNNSSNAAPILAGLCAMTAAKIVPVAVEKFDNKTSDVTAAVNAFVKAKPQAVLLIASAKGASNLIKGARLAGLSTHWHR